MIVLQTLLTVLLPICTFFLANLLSVLSLFLSSFSLSLYLKLYPLNVTGDQGLSNRPSFKDQGNGAIFKNSLHL